MAKMKKQYCFLCYGEILNKKETTVTFCTRCKQQTLVFSTRSEVRKQNIIVEKMGEKLASEIDQLASNFLNQQ